MYSKKLSTKNPGCILILVDQSGSMSEPIAQSSATKKLACAKAVNSVLYQLVFSCASGEEIKDRVQVGMIGYGASVASAFQGPLAGRDFVPISEIASTQLRFDTNPEGHQIPVWLEPTSGGSTPMEQSFKLAFAWLSPWIAKYPDSFPPIVINITDGEPNDATAAQAEAKTLLSLKTSDGGLLLLNAHLSNASHQEIVLPSPKTALPDKYARYLFDLSSELPEALLATAQAIGLQNEGLASRGFVYNANADTLVRLLTFGTTVGLR